MRLFANSLNLPEQKYFLWLAVFKWQRLESRQVTRVLFDIPITIITRPKLRCVKATNDVVLVLCSRYQMYLNETSSRISKRSVSKYFKQMYFLTCRVSG